MPTVIPSSLTTSRTLTVYNDGFGQLNETRKIPPIDGDMVVHFEDVAKQIEANSVIIDGFTVRIQQYAFDLSSQEKLFEKYIGREVIVFNVKTGLSREFKLLSTAGGYVMEDIDSNELIANPKGEIHLPKLPNVFLKPTLIWQIANKTSDHVRVSYLTQGISWEVSYVLKLKDDRFDLTGWVVLSNFSGKTYKDTILRLIAGTVHRAPQLLMRQAMFETAGPADLAQQQPFSDYHLYTLQGRYTIQDNTQTQLQLATTKNANAKTIYEVNQFSEHPSIIIEFLNTKENGLGFPLPRGIVKMYRELPTNGTLQFIGEDRMNHTAVNEKVRLKAGEAFDITVESGTVDSYKQGNSDFEVIQYKIRNAKNEQIEVIIRHVVHERNWTVTESSHPWERKLNEILIPVNIPPNEEVTVRFTIRYDRSVRVIPQ